MNITIKLSLLALPTALFSTAIIQIMDHFALQLPQEFAIIIDKLKKQDWLLSYFSASEEEMYNPAGYAYNTEFHQYKYKILLDRNIFRFIVSASTSKTPKEKNRDAIALICFCQAAKIIFEPNLAVYERLLPKRKSTKPAIEELIAFYKIDNADGYSLIDYAVGETNSIEFYPESPWNLDKLHEELTQYKWLTEWKSLYVILLKMVVVDHQNLHPREKLNEFMLWLVKDFRLSLPCIVFAIFLFSSRRLKNMNKVKRKSENSQKMDDIYNMTWDIFLMNEFFRTLTKEDKESEFLVATDDKIIKFVLRAALGVQDAGSLNYLKSLLPNHEHGHVDMADVIMNNTIDRIYDTEEWTPEYRDVLISKYESEMLSIK